MTKTNKEIIAFQNFAIGYLDKNPKESKFRYAVSRMRKRCEKLIEDFQEESQSIDIKHCAVDKDKVIRKDARGGFEFTQEGLTLRNKEQKELARKEIEVEPYIATESPPEPLSLEEVEVCEGFVLETKPE